MAGAPAASRVGRTSVQRPYDGRVVLRAASHASILACLLGASMSADLRASAPLAGESPLEPGASVDFNRDVRPILADRCFRCHGPDIGERKRGLRLDTEEGSRALLKSGARAIVPGAASQSELIARITSDDFSEVMPPPALHRPLSEAEKAILTRWVEQGATYAQHWAFAALQAKEPAQIPSRPWARDPIDHFVLERLEQAGLAPSPEADRAALLRRTAFVLTGLPPEPEAVAAFEADNSPGAFDKQVDALLASPRYGEHMASTWLDVARYADTFGYQSDWECHTWPWRDWLIQALNKDLAYDEFVTQVIAGDLLPGATHQQRLATAFHRLHRLTNEGGSIDEEFRQEALADRVATTGVAFLGLTLECARCHDHKYDPISQREFYSLTTFFGAGDEAGTYAYSHSSTPPPALGLPTPGQARVLQALETVLRTAEAEYEGALLAAQAAYETWSAAGPRVEVAPPVKRVALDGPSPQSAVEHPRAVAAPAGQGLGSIPRLDEHGQATSVATLFDGDNGVVVEGLPQFRRADPYSLAFFMRCQDTKPRATILHTALFTIESDQQGFQVMLDQGRLAWQVIHFWPGSAAAVRTRAAFPIDRWVHVVVTYDGSSSAGGMAVYFDGILTPTEIVKDSLDGVATAKIFQIGFRDRDLGFQGGALDDLEIYDRALTEPEALELARPGSGSSSNHLARYFLEVIDPDCRKAREQLHAARAMRNELADALPSVMVMADAPRARAGFLLRRGAYDDPDLTQPVSSDRALDALLAFDASWPKNRLGLARWLTDARNPIVARVQANRLWMQCFGRGIVPSQENFGLQGEYPSHPELLDHLALAFVAGGWSNKALLRRIVLSSTFRQSSHAPAALRASDPENALLARGPAMRLSAEMLRDQALFVSQSLVEQIGGPSVRPWQPLDLWEAAGATGSYTPDTGESARRRSLYTFRKRTAPPPNMTLFDAGSREKCEARRQATNTPLQALVLLNDPVFLDCARALAVLACRQATTTRGRVEFVIRRISCREPRPVEVEVLAALYSWESQRMFTDSRSAGQGASGDPDSPDPSSQEIRALSLVASTFLMSDAALMIR